MSERKQIYLPRDTLAQYVGTYRSSPDVVLIVTLEGSQLMVERSGSPKTPVFAQSETTFFFKDIEDRLEFLKNATGAVIGAVRYVPSVDRSRTYSRVTQSP